MSHGIGEHDRQTAIHDDRILMGAKPRHLPVEARTELELAIDLNASNALGSRPHNLSSCAQTR